MLVRDLIELYCDPEFAEIEIYNLDTEKTLFKGLADEMPEEFDDLEIVSLDTPYKDIQVINI